MAALTCFVSMQTCLVPLPSCFKWRSICPSFPKYGLQTCNRKVPLRKWVCRVDHKFSGGDYGALGTGGGDEGSLKDREQFVRNSGRTYVVVVSPAFVVSGHMKTLLKDISILHRLGLKFVLVPGTDRLLNLRLIQGGFRPKYVGPLRIIDRFCLKLALGEVGKVMCDIQAILSSDDTPVPVEIGMYTLAAKMSDQFGATGVVTEVHADLVTKGLDADHVVLLCQIGRSVFGEMLYCDLYDVATSCALGLRAERLIYVLDSTFEGPPGNLPFHAVYGAIHGRVAVHALDGCVDGAMLTFFQKTAPGHN